MIRSQYRSFLQNRPVIFYALHGFFTTLRRWSALIGRLKQIKIYIKYNTYVCEKLHTNIRSMTTQTKKLKVIAVFCMLLLSPVFRIGNTLFAQAPNTWTQKANFGGSARDGAFAFSIGTKGYMGGGNNNGNFRNDVWEYDPTTDAWVQKSSVPNNEYLASSFVIGSKAYIGCGYNTNNAFYEFDPVANTWTAKAPFPGTQRYITAGFSIGTKGYCGGGYTPVNPYPT